MSEVEISVLSKQVADLGDRIEKGLATKSEVDSVRDAVKALENRMAEAADKNEKVDVFGNKFLADMAVRSFLKAAQMNPNFVVKSTDKVYSYKATNAALITGGSDSGDYALPTLLDPVISQLIGKYGYWLNPPCHRGYQIAARTPESLSMFRKLTSRTALRTLY